MKWTSHRSSLSPNNARRDDFFGGFNHCTHEPSCDAGSWEKSSAQVVHPADWQSAKQQTKSKQTTLGHCYRSADAHIRDITGATNCADVGIRAPMTARETVPIPIVLI